MKKLFLILLLALAFCACGVSEEPDFEETILVETNPGENCTLPEEEENIPEPEEPEVVPIPEKWSMGGIFARHRRFRSDSGRLFSAAGCH